VTEKDKYNIINILYSQEIFMKRKFTCVTSLKAARTW